MKIETYAGTAALFLTVVLLVGLYARHNPDESRGKWIYVAGCEDPHPYQPIESRLVILQIAADRSLKINSTELDRRSFPNPLPEIFQSRTVKRLYVIAAPEISFQDFITDTSKVKDAIPDLQIVVITPTLVQNPCGLISPPVKFE